MSTMDNNPRCYMHLWCQFLGKIENVESKAFCERPLKVPILCLLKFNIKGLSVLANIMSMIRSLWQLWELKRWKTGEKDNAGSDLFTFSTLGPCRGRRQHCPEKLLATNVRKILISGQTEDFPGGFSGSGGSWDENSCFCFVLAGTGGSRVIVFWSGCVVETTLRWQSGRACFHHLSVSSCNSRTPL